MYYQIYKIYINRSQSSVSNFFHKSQGTFGKFGEGKYLTLDGFNPPPAGTRAPQGPAGFPGFASPQARRRPGAGGAQRGEGRGPEGDPGRGGEVVGGGRARKGN